MKFRLKTLLLTIAAIALVLAPVAPWYRGMNQSQQSAFQWKLLMTGCGMMTWVVAFNLVRRLARWRMGECIVQLPAAQRAPGLSFGWLMMVISAASICSAIHTAVILQSRLPALDEGWNSVFFFGMLFAQGIAFGPLQWFERVDICERGLIMNGLACKKWRLVSQVGWVRRNGFLRITFGSFETTHNVPIDQRDLVERILTDAGKFSDPPPFE